VVTKVGSLLRNAFLWQFCLLGSQTFTAVDLALYSHCARSDFVPSGSWAATALAVVPVF
jgi:hypothetical protein